MEPTAPAAALAAAAAHALGVEDQPKHLTGRKGADTWRAGTWTIKTAPPGARGHLAHEHAAYELLHHQVGTRWVQSARRRDGSDDRDQIPPDVPAHSATSRTAFRQ